MVGDGVGNVKPVSSPTSGNVGGHPITTGTNTVLGKVMGERGIHLHRVTSLLGCSDRSLRYYLEGVRRVPLANFHLVCDLLDMDFEELVDEGGMLRRSEVSDSDYAAPDTTPRSPTGGDPWDRDDGW